MLSEARENELRRLAMQISATLDTTDAAKVGSALDVAAKVVDLLGDGAEERRLAAQIAGQMPESKEDAAIVIGYVRELLDWTSPQPERRHSLRRVAGFKKLD